MTLQHIARETNPSLPTKKNETFESFFFDVRYIASPFKVIMAILQIVQLGKLMNFKV